MKSTPCVDCVVSASSFDRRSDSFLVESVGLFQVRIRSTLAAEKILLARRLRRLESIDVDRFQSPRACTHNRLQIMNSATDRLWSLSIRDIMSPNVESLRTTQTMSEAADIFSEHHISGAPVVAETGQCEGVLSVFDFVRNRDASHEQIDAHMTRPAKTISADAPLLTAARLMCDEHVHRLIVVDEEGRPIATTTSLDLVSAMMNAMEECTQTRSLGNV